MRLAAIALATFGLRVARGDDATERARTRSASPDAPFFTVAWRGAMRATLAARVPLIAGDGAALPTLSATPFVELHDEPGSRAPLPNEDWRGRASLAADWTLSRALGRWIALGVALDHESDHAAARVGVAPAVLHLHDVALRASLGASVGGEATLAAGVDGALFVGSCTTRDAGCHGFEGASSGGGAAWAVLDLAGARALDGPDRWAPFAAVDASMILPRGVLLAERRVVLHLGVGDARWQLFGSAWVGNAVGLDRAERRTELGVGVRWTGLDAR